MAGIGTGTYLLGSALLGGISGYFGGKGNESAARSKAESDRYSVDVQAGLAREQLAENKRQADLNETFRQAQLADQEQAVRDAAATKKAAAGVISSGYDTTGYDKTLDYVDPYQTGVSSAINTLLAGGLTDAEKAQQAKAISTGQQQVGANAATMGLPAGARALLSGQNSSDIMNNYAVMGSGRVASGLSAANTATNTGLNIADTNYNTALQNFLNQQKLKNDKTTLLAGYATPNYNRTYGLV